MKTKKTEMNVFNPTNKAYTIWFNASNLKWELLEVGVDPINLTAGDIKVLYSDTHRDTVFEQLKIEISLMLGDS